MSPPLQLLAPSWAPLEDRDPNSPSHILPPQSSPAPQLSNATDVQPITRRRTRRQKKKLDRQLRRLREQELREPPIIRPMLASDIHRWHDFMAYGPGRERQRWTAQEREEANQRLLRVQKEDAERSDERAQRSKELRKAKEESLEKKKRKGWKWFEAKKNFILTNPLAPLVFRFLVFAISTIAFGLSLKYHLMVRNHLPNFNFSRDEMLLSLPSNQTSTSNSDKLATPAFWGCWHRPSASLFTPVWSFIALVFTVVMSFDEFLSPPIGLRHWPVKLGLTLLDMIFITINGASLTTVAILIQSCLYPPIYQHVLLAVLIVGELFWVLNMSVSVVRIAWQISPPR